MDHIRVNSDPLKELESRDLAWSLNWLIFVVFEDFPQIVLQTTNNILIGKDLGWENVLAPAIGFISSCIAIIDMIFIFYHYSQQYKRKHKEDIEEKSSNNFSNQPRQFQCCLLTLCNVCWMLPCISVVMVLNGIVYQD
jgi:hypothetical protein